MLKSTAAVLLLSVAIWPTTAVSAGQNNLTLDIDEHALFRAVGSMYQLDPDLLQAIATAESAGRLDAVSHSGAIGLMQLMPKTAARFGVDDPFDPVESTLGAARFLDYLKRNPNVLDRLPELLAAYNAGEGAVVRFGGIPPYLETKDYVRRVLWLYLMSFDGADSNMPKIKISKPTAQPKRNPEKAVLDKLRELQRERSAAQTTDPSH